MSKIVRLPNNGTRRGMTQSPSVGRGRPSRSVLDDRVREALRSLDDPIALEESALVSLPTVRQLVATRFRGRTCAEGLALAFVLKGALAEIATDLAETPVGVLAAALRDGRTQTWAASALNISDEHLCRRWKPVLVSLVRRRLETLPARQEAA